MMHGAAQATGQNGLRQTLLSSVDKDGSSAHPYMSSSALNDDPESARNVADVIHYLGILHGRQPGVVELASMKTAIPETRPWLEQAETGFSRERLFVSQLAVAAGPLPSTPGHDKSEAAALSQRHAIETLARSERAGCALGAAIALILDWQAIRSILISAAARLDIDAPLSALPGRSDTVSLIEQVSGDPAIGRAVAFGAEQILAQHRGLWDLLEARETARDMW